jgi:hypothetical protein
MCTVGDPGSASLVLARIICSRSALVNGLSGVFAASALPTTTTIVRNPAATSCCNTSRCQLWNGWNRPMYSACERCATEDIARVFQKKKERKRAFATSSASKKRARPHAKEMEELDIVNVDGQEEHVEATAVNEGNGRGKLVRDTLSMIWFIVSLLLASVVCVVAVVQATTPHRGMCSVVAIEWSNSSFEVEWLVDLVGDGADGDTDLPSNETIHQQFATEQEAATAVAQVPVGSNQTCYYFTSFETTLWTSSYWRQQWILLPPTITVVAVTLTAVICCMGLVLGFNPLGFGTHRITPTS